MIIGWDDFWLQCIAILVSGFIHFRRLIYVTRYLKLNIIRGESNFDVEHVLRLSLSKYSNENTEGQREEGFHVNSNWTWVKSKHSLSYIKLTDPPPRVRQSPQGLPGCRVRISAKSVDHIVVLCEHIGMFCDHIVVLCEHIAEVCDHIGTNQQNVARFRVYRHWFFGSKRSF